jgi:hypothetical protein
MRSLIPKHLSRIRSRLLLCHNRGNGSPIGGLKSLPAGYCHRQNALQSNTGNHWSRYAFYVTAESVALVTTIRSKL